MQTLAGSFLRSFAGLVSLALTAAFPASASSGTPATFALDSGSAQILGRPAPMRSAAAPHRSLSLLAHSASLATGPAGVTPDVKKPFSNPGTINNGGRIGEPILLDGSRSSDPYGQPLTYHWAVVSLPVGSTASLDDPTSITPTLAPIDVAGTYVVQLIVSDSTLSSDPATLSITPEIDAPIAEALTSSDFGELHVGEPTQLDGSRSTDENESPLTYAWSITSAPAGSRAALSSATAVKPTFTPDIYGAYSFQLIVRDKYLTSLPNTLNITTTILPPLANAGKDLTVAVGQTVLLNGAASKDVDGFPLLYSWSLLSKPAASNAILAGKYSARPSFVVDEPGLYVAQLIVNNGSYDSVPAVVDIATHMLPPVADAGSAQTAALHHLVQLDGTASFDTTGLPLTFSWSLLSVPAGSMSLLSSATAAKPTITPDVYGIYVAQLIVNNGTYKSTPKTISIDVVPGPIANAGPNQTVALGSTVMLTGAASYDPSGHPLTYAWSVLSAPGSKPSLSNASSSTPSFVPSAVGAYVVNLVVGNGTTTGVPSTVQITVAAPQLTIYPASLVFPDEALDSVSAPKSVSLLNAGTVPVTLSNLLATGDFSHQLTTTCNGTLAAGALCSISVIFSPSALGTRTGTLSLSTNVPGSPQSVALRGKSLASAATQLVFTTSPRSTIVNSPLAPLTVAIEDATGHVVTAATGPVTVTFGSKPGKGVLSGTATVNAVAGIATFSTLSINQVGVGYRLLASTAALSPGTSAPFNVVAGAPAQLVFLQQPTTIASKVPFSPVVAVGVEDGYGNLVDAPSLTVTLNLGSTKSGVGALAGTNSVAVVHGVATFPNLTVGPAGEFAAIPHERGYFLTASSPGLPSLRSFSFDLLKPAFTFAAGALGNNTSVSLEIEPPYPDGGSEEDFYRPEQDETLTITSNDPKHFLLTLDPTKIGTATVSLTYTPESFPDELPAIYVQGRNFAGTKPITGTLSLNLPEFMPSTASAVLYPSAIELKTSADSTLGGAQTINLNLSLFLLDPKTLQTIPQDPDSFPSLLSPGVSPTVYSISNSNPAVGVISTPSPAQFPAGASTVSRPYQLLTYGVSTVHLIEPAGFSVPSDTSNSITETVVPPDSFVVTVPTLGSHSEAYLSVALLKPATSTTQVTITSSDPAHFLVGIDGSPASGSITVPISRGSTSPIANLLIYGQNFSGNVALKGLLSVSAPGHSTATTPLTLLPTALSFGMEYSLYACVGESGFNLPVQQALLNPGTLTYAGYTEGPSTLVKDVYSITSANSSIASIEGSPAVFTTNDQYTSGVDFVARNIGKTTFTLTEPPGYATPTNLPVKINVTVGPTQGGFGCDPPK